MQIMIHIQHTVFHLYSVQCPKYHSPFRFNMTLDAHPEMIQNLQAISKPGTLCIIL